LGRGGVSSGAEGAHLGGPLQQTRRHPQLADGHDPIVSHGGFPQHRHRIGLPVLGVKGVNTHRIAHFREAIRQGTNGWNLTWLYAGMDQGTHPSLPPTGGNPIHIGVELSENNVAMGIHQWGWLVPCTGGGFNGRH
jgi:hypothetical protein